MDTDFMSATKVRISWIKWYLASTGLGLIWWFRDCLTRFQMPSSPPYFKASNVTQTRVPFTGSSRMSHL